MENLEPGYLYLAFTMSVDETLSQAGCQAAGSRRAAQLALFDQRPGGQTCQIMPTCMGGSINEGTPKWLVYNGKSH